MIHYSDDEYREAKRMKMGEASIPSPYSELAKAEALYRERKAAIPLRQKSAEK